MTQRLFWWTTALVLILIVIGAYAFSGTGQAARARTVVTGFGSSLQKVSLLATSTDVVASMHDAYADYVSPELLAQWETNPEYGPGRLTSSPWPDHIDVSTVTRQSDGSYEVKGTLVEKTSTGEAGNYAVTARVRNTSGKWRMTAFSGYPPVQVPATGTIRVEGEMVCLPHKDMSGPQTLECAFGLKDDRGRYFGLADSDPQYANVSGVGSGARIRVEGTFTPRTDSKYQDIGVITVTTITKLDASAGE